MKVLLVLLLLLGTALALSQAGGKLELVQSSGYCSSGWFEFKGRCFRYIPTAMSWAKAERNCLSMQANLASVHSSEEYRFIQNLIWTFTHASGETWIGGSDAQEEKIWLWSNGRTFHYTNWCHKEPNNAKGNQNCLQMNRGDGKCFDDQWCDVHRPSVCTKTI